MWSSRKKRNIDLYPGQNFDLNFITSWNPYKNEVTIITENGPISLDEKKELYLHIKGDNIDPLKIQIIPDFEKMVLNFVEIIDPKVKRKFTDDSGPKISFSASIIKENKMTFGDYLKFWDKDIQKLETLGKNSKKFNKIFVGIQFGVCVLNLYMFATRTSIWRYLNLVIAIFSIFAIYYFRINNKRIQNMIKKFKKEREEAFGMVKEI